MHIVQIQRFAFDTVISASLTVGTLGSNAVIEFIVIYSSCYTMLVSIATTCILQLHLHRGVVASFHGCEFLPKID